MTSEADRDLTAAITRVALSVHAPDEFRSAAHAVARTLGPGAAEQLADQFHRAPQPPPAEFGPQADTCSGRIAWMQAWQAASFELLYHLGPAALPVLRRVAFGGYDWTQIHAIQTLVRLATDGVQPVELARELAGALPTFRYEALFSVLPALATLRPPIPELIQALEQQFTEHQGDPADAITVLACLAEYAPEPARAHVDFLRQAMRGRGLEHRHPLLDGAVLIQREGKEEVAWGPRGAPPADQHAIRAARLLRHLIPGDPEAEARLQEWADHHPDEGVRSELRRVLGDK